VLKPFFKRFDANADGSISVGELRPLLHALGEEATAAQAAKWMAVLDPDGSGQISTAEFTDAMLNFIRLKMRAADARAAGAGPDVRAQLGEATLTRGLAPLDAATTPAPPAGARLLSQAGPVFTPLHFTPLHSHLSIHASRFTGERRPHAEPARSPRRRCERRCERGERRQWLARC